MNSYDILVIILSVCLAVFLILSIVVLIYLVKFVKNIKEISEKAKDMVNNAESIIGTMKKAAAPAVVAKFVADQISNAVKKHTK